MTNPIIIYHTDDGKAKVSLYAKDGTVWLSQSQLAELFATSVPNINMHISNILKEKELSKDSVIQYFLITATDGKNDNIAFYSLEMILAIGFHVHTSENGLTKKCVNSPLFLATTTLMATPPKCFLPKPKINLAIQKPPQSTKRSISE